MSCSSRGQFVRAIALGVASLLTDAFVARARAGILPELSGNHRAVPEESGPAIADVSFSFAVFQRGGTPGDTFGVGVPGFDSAFLNAGNSGALDVTAEYLYLYQVVNDGGGTANIFGPEIDHVRATSWGHWLAGFQDADGLVDAGNPLGPNGAPYQPAAPPNLGAPSGSVTNFTGHLDKEPFPLTYNETTDYLTAHFTLLPPRYDPFPVFKQGETSTIFGFTSNERPVVRHATPAGCYRDDLACGSYVAPDRPTETSPGMAFVPVHPRSTYLRAAGEAFEPYDPAVVELATVIPDTPLAAGDWVLLQRVGDFVFVDSENPAGLPPELQGPHADQRPGTLRNLFGVFASSGELLDDEQAVAGAKPAPIAPGDPLYSRVRFPVAVTEGDVDLIDSDHPSRFNRDPDTPRGDPFNNQTEYQLTDIPGDFYIDLEGERIDAGAPVLVRIPEGATHLFAGAGDGQFFDNRYSDSGLYPDGEMTDRFGLKIVRVEPGRLLGDYNLDGVVNAADYTVWRDQRGAEGLMLSADGNADGVVNGADHAVWAANYGLIVGPPAAAIPEPATLCLLAGTLGGLGARRLATGRCDAQHSTR